MRRPRGDRVMTVVLLGIVAAMGVETLAMGSAARRVPAPVLWITLPLLLIQLLSELVPAIGRATERYRARPEAADGMPSLEGLPRGAIRAGVLWVAALPALAAAAGLLPGAALYLLLYLRARAGLGWGRALAAGLVLAAGLHLLLERLLGLPLPRGPFL